MQKYVCDVCGCDCADNSDYTVSIGAFGGREIRVSAQFRQTICGPKDGIDLCRGCKEKALRVALVVWRDEAKKTVGMMERNLMAHQVG